MKPNQNNLGEQGHNSLLSDGVVALRALEPTDLDILYNWENDTNAWKVTDTPAPFSRQLLWQYLKTYTTDIYESKQLRLMITLASTGESAGIADLMNFDPLNNRAEMGLYVASQFRGLGIAKATIALLQQYVTQHLGIKQIYVKIIADHTSTIMLHEECGFKQAGTLRSWVKRGKEYFDVVIMQWLSC